MLVCSRIEGGAGSFARVMRCGPGSFIYAEGWAPRELYGTGQKLVRFRNLYSVVYISRNEVLTFMRGDEVEIFRKLCQQATVEHDHDKLLELIRAITHMLDTKEGRVRNSESNKHRAV